MSNGDTVAKLLELAIGAEKAAEELYRRLEAKFAQHRDIADFWRGYAAEEAGHARWLEKLRATLSPAQLSAPADPGMLKEAYMIAQFSIENALKQVKNLEDAYQLVNELEHSETNVVFEFLITHYASDKEAQSFLRSQLKDHISRLVAEFPAGLRTRASRQAIRVLE
jgi:rubrerythrin